MELLRRYKDENAHIKEELAASEVRREELENDLKKHRDEQEEIEQGILKALDQLNNIEDVVGNLKKVGTRREVAPVGTREAASHIALEPSHEHDESKHDDNPSIDIDIDIDIDSSADDDHSDHDNADNAASEINNEVESGDDGSSEEEQLDIF